MTTKTYAKLDHHAVYATNNITLTLDAVTAGISGEVVTLSV